MHVFGFASVQDAGAREWQRAARALLDSIPSSATSPTATEPTGPVCGWRLVSDNHRDIARSPAFSANEESARREAARIARRASSLVLRVAPVPLVRSTQWFATLDDEFVLVGSRGYENRATARNAGALAIRSLAILSGSLHELDLMAESRR